MHQLSPIPKPAFINFKSAPAQQVIDNIKDYQTPQKAEVKDSLRTEIRERLFAKKYQQYSGTCTGTGREQQSQQYNNSHEVQYEQNSNSIRALIIQLQSVENQGYYMYNDWINLNGYLFPEVQKRFIENLWKILRLINFGQVAIPSGLIHDVIKQIQNKHLNIKTQQQNIIETINEFLYDNNIKNKYESFKQLQYYIPLNKILRGYKLEKQQIETSNTNINIQQVFQNLYNDSKARKQKSTVKQVATHKKQTQGCTFAPSIKSYRQSQTSLKRYHRYNCDSVTKHIFETDRSKQQQLHFEPIKARPVDPKIYKAKVQNVKGVKQHINRTVDSYRQKLKLKRSMQKPVILKKY